MQFKTIPIYTYCHVNSDRMYDQHNSCRVEPYIDGLVQERRNSIANALELRLSCTNRSIWMMMKTTVATSAKGHDRSWLMKMREWLFPELLVAENGLLDSVTHTIDVLFGNWKNSVFCDVALLKAAFVPIHDDQRCISTFYTPMFICIADWANPCGKSLHTNESMNSTQSI